MSHGNDSATAVDQSVDTCSRVVREIPHWVYICGLAFRGALVGLIPFAFTPISTFATTSIRICPALLFLLTAIPFSVTAGYQMLYWGGGKWWQRFSVLSIVR